MCHSLIGLDVQASVFLKAGSGIPLGTAAAEEASTINEPGVPLPSTICVRSLSRHHGKRLHSSAPFASTIKAVPEEAFKTTENADPSKTLLNAGLSLKHFSYQESETKKRRNTEA